jgi:uncharacterized membrane protein YccC
LPDPGRSAGELTTAVVAGRAIRSAGQVDRGAISLRAGRIAALPVAGALLLGTAIGQPVAAVTMAVGAMLSGVAWRAAGGTTHPPVATMVAAGGGLALATVAGTLSGRWPWVHLVLLTVVCLAAGLLSALGRRGGVVGTQTVIAFIVFGRFPEPVGPAFALAGLVGLGATFEVGFATLVALPPAWRRQRGAVADAYERLADLARLAGSSALAAATALDLADQRVSAPALLADPAVIALSNLVQEGRRIRLSIMVLWQAAEQSSTGAGGDRHGRAGVDHDQQRQVTAELGRAATILGRIAATARDRRLGAPDVEASPTLRDPRTGALLASLTGQLAAAARMAQQARGTTDRRAVAHPSLGSRLPLSSLRSDLSRLRASATLQSSAGRHAVRLAVVVAGTELLTQRIALPRGYWAVVAAATVLRPEFGATITRGVERVGGTCAGVVIATLIAVGLRPDGWGITAIVVLLATGTYAVFPASFAAGTAGLTAVVVFLLHAVAPDSATIALDRGIDTAIGGAIGLTAYLLWPTWSGASVAKLLAEVADAQRGYLGRVLAALVDGTVAPDAELAPLARRARLAYSDAEAAVTLMRSEPLRAIDPADAGAVLGGLRRDVYGIHALRLELRATGPGSPRPELAPLSAGLIEELSLIAGRLRGEPPPTDLPPLRALFDAATTRAGAAIRVALDELVDAANTTADAAGLVIAEPAEPRPAGRSAG